MFLFTIPNPNIWHNLSITLHQLLIFSKPEIIHYLIFILRQTSILYFETISIVEWPISIVRILMLLTVFSVSFWYSFLSNWLLLFLLLYFERNCWWSLIVLSWLKEYILLACLYYGTLCAYCQGIQLMQFDWVYFLIYWDCFWTKC